MKGKMQKFSFRSVACAVERGVASVARPYRIPGHNLNLYAIQPSRAGKCSFVIFDVHFMNLPVTFFDRCSVSLPSTVDQTPNIFSAVDTSA